eukprot:10824950-Lingulodinium_polyedra.AAC.1
MANAVPDRGRARGGALQSKPAVVGALCGRPAGGFGGQSGENRGYCSRMGSSAVAYRPCVGQDIVREGVGK